MKRIFCIFLLIFMLTVTLTSCGFTVPRPEIKEGKFRFSITYELNGEVKIFSGLCVCEYNGVDWSLDGGYGRDWDLHTEGDYKGDDYSAVIGTTEDGGEIILFFGIYAEYFMGDTSGDRGVPEPSVYVAYPENEHGETTLVNDPTEVEELYGVKIISSEYASPVENSFGLFK